MHSHFLRHILEVMIQITDLSHLLKTLILKSFSRLDKYNKKFINVFLQLFAATPFHLEGTTAILNFSLSFIATPSRHKLKIA